MGLFEPIWMTRNSSKENKAREEIFKIKDVEKLKEIAIKAPLPSIKCAAAYNIDDDNVCNDHVDACAKVCPCGYGLYL